MSGVETVYPDPPNTHQASYLGECQIILLFLLVESGGDAGGGKGGKKGGKKKGGSFQTVSAVFRVQK